MFMRNTMARQRMRARRIREAFTLVELVVLIAILAILAELLLPSRLLAATGDAANWPQFRGPNGSGIADACRPPVNIVADQAAWKTPLPPGKSSPVL
jgi:hypothetical protein